MNIPTLHDVLRAQQCIRPYLARTPLQSYPTLNELLETEVFIKHENYQPVGVFKVRGSVNLVSQLSQDERERGIIAASTGNHGQSVAYAARLFGVRTRIVMPNGTSPSKVATTRALGAEVIMHGTTYDEARLYCESLAQEHKYRYIYSGHDPLLIAGVATGTLEMLEDEPDLDVILVPVGGGSGAS